MNLSEKEKDLVTRTIIGEAANEPDEGQAAVAHVILNRVNSGKYGDGISGVLFKDKQFEPWVNPKKLMSYSTESPEYIKASTVLNNVLKGNVEDPTKGATHFANVDTVKQRGNNTALGWISNMSDVTKIGSHTFGKADKVAQADIDIDSLANKYGGGSNTSEIKPTSDDNSSLNIDNLVSKYGGSEITLSQSIKNNSKNIYQIHDANNNIKNIDETEYNSIMKDNPPAIPMHLADGTYLYKIKTPEKIKEDEEKEKNKPGLLSQFGTNFKESLNEAYQSGKNLTTESVDDFSKGRLASAAIKLPVGVLSQVTAPITAGVHEIVGKPAKGVGGQEFANKAELIASLALPVNKLSGVVKGAAPSNKAIKDIIEVVGQENLPEIIDRLKSNPRLSIMDVSDPVKQMGQKLILTEGKHQPVFSNFVKERTSGAKEAITEAVDKTMGAPVNVLDKIETMKANARATGQNIINPIVEKSKSANITDIVNNIDDLISKSGPTEKATLKALKEGNEPALPLSDTQSKLFNIRERLRGDWKDRNEMFLDVKGEQGLHQIQMDLRREASEFMNSSDGSKRLLGQKLMNVRDKIVNKIDEAAPGYKEGLLKYADDMHVQEGFDKGIKIFKNTTMEDRPEYLERWLKTAKPEQIEAYKEGARLAYDNQIKAARNAQKGAILPEIEFNAEKLEKLFGKKETQEMFRKLQDQRSIAKTNQGLTGDSQTAMRMKANNKIDLPEKKAFGASLPNWALMETLSTISGAPGVGTALNLGLNTASKGLNIAQRSLAMKKNNVLTDLLTAKGQTRENLIKELEKALPQSKTSMLRRVPDNKLLNAVSTANVPAELNNR